MDTIRRGDKGADVRKCQQLLNLHGYNVAVDGDFGPGTEKAVKEFQASSGLTADGIVGNNTWNALMETPGDSMPPEPLPPVLQHAKEMGYKIWDEPYRLWLFGIRSKNSQSNSFDDTLGCYYATEDGGWVSYFWPGTTDPGTYWLENPSRVEGTAILVEDQYLDTWKIDLHAGKYEALCQRAGEVKVYRDGNKDDQLDEDPNTIMKGYFGINIHRSSISGESSVVDKWSAGCQVFKRLDDFNKMMKLAHKQKDKTGVQTFSYTLFREWEE
jgi:hypothetical protein